MQRAYAYMVLALRGGTGWLVRSWWTDYKADLVMTLAQSLLVLNVLYAISAATGHMLAVVRDRHAVVAFFIVLALSLYVLNQRAQRNLLPRFRQDYLSLRRWVRFSIAAGTVLATFLLLMCCKGLALATRGLT